MIRLFCCLNGRDMFLKSYEKELANRLLNKTSISNEYEEQMIQKLKVECGATQVQKMTGMSKDITLSRDIQQNFNQSIGGQNQINGVEFNIEVLTNGTWPQMHEPPCNLPRELKACTEKFTMWYKNANSNKQLNWLYSNGQVELIVQYTPKKYQLIVNVF